MRKIITTTFVTLDGVLQAPGGPEEDTTNNFKWGGWVFHFWDEMMGNTMDDFMKRPFDLLLGRRTYEIFAAYWPHVKNGPIADNFNGTDKYVVSHNIIKLDWQHSKLITGDIVAELRKLKAQDGNDLWVHGSGNLIQTLLKNDLVDTLYIWTFPVLVGNGKRLFAEDTKARALKLVDSKTSTTGVTIAEYIPAGDLKTGTIGQQDPTA